MKKIYLLLGLLFALSLGACGTGGNADDTASTGGSSVSNTDSDTGSDTNSDTNSDTAGDHVHTWGEATYSWNGLECTAEVACTGSDCEETLTETVTASYVKDTDATCYYNESGHFEALFENEVFVDQITEANSAEQEDTMLAHSLTDVTYVWEGNVCTASTACTVEACGTTITETVTANLLEDTAGDCYNNARGHYEAVFESAYLTTQTTEVNGIEIPDTKKHETEMYLDEDRRQYVTACTLCKEEFAVEDNYATYVDGEKLNGGLNYVLPAPVPMADLQGKALRFEFKFTSETGSFSFSLSGNDWLHITNIVTITKTEGGFTVTDSGNGMACGRIVDIGNGWYAWEINAAAFPNAVAATAQSIDIIIPRNPVEGTVYIDWNSLSIVEAYTSRDVPTVYKTGDSLGRTNFSSAILMSQMEGKAIRFEFKFVSETGSFSFQVMGLEWNRISEIVIVTKTANDISANFGRIVDAGDGWYAWELNKSSFKGDGAANATTIDFIYPRETVVGDLYVDWQSVSVVDAYVVDTRIEESTKYQTGEKLNGGANYVLPTPVPMAALSGKAVRFEFKFETETGSFAFSLLQYSPWKPLTNVVTLTKTESGFTVTDAHGNKPCGRIVDAGDGWYAWELNAADFPTGTAAEAEVFDLIVPRNTVVGTLYLNWNSLTIVDAYEVETDPRLEAATKYENGEKLNGGLNYVLPAPVPMAALSGKALRFEFKFESETGSFAFSLSGNDWLHITNIVTITKTESGFTVTDSDGNKPCGRIVDAGDGWYAWEINAADFPNVEAATATSIDIIIPRNTVVGTLYLDWNSLAIVNAYTE